MPQYNRRDLDVRAREYGFNRDTFEKVLRLKMRRLLAAYGIIQWRYGNVNDIIKNMDYQQHLHMLNLEKVLSHINELKRRQI